MEIATINMTSDKRQILAEMKLYILIYMHIKFTRMSNMPENSISSLWFTWYLLSDLEGSLKRLRQPHQVIMATGLGLDGWERQMLSVAESLDDALRNAQDAGLDVHDLCPDLLPSRTLPWPLRGLHRGDLSIRAFRCNLEQAIRH